MILTTFPRHSFPDPLVKGAWVDDAYQLTVDLPGVADDAVGVSVAGRTLTIDVATESTTWSRQLRLAQTLDPEQVRARYLNGRLTVTIGKTASPQARRITVDTAPAQTELAPSADTESSAASAVSGAATSVTG